MQKYFALTFALTFTLACSSITKKIQSRPGGSEFFEMGSKLNRKLIWPH